jgi:hypothetical protein
MARPLRIELSIGISNALFQESSMYPMIVKRSNARANSKNPWLTQPRRQFPHSARANSTLSERLPERRPSTSPSPLKIQSGFTPHAASNSSIRTAGARGGGCAASPRWVRMRSMTAGSSMAAISFSCPPQCEHFSMSMSNTRFNNCAQRMRPFPFPAGLVAPSPSCAGVATAAVGTGTTALRSSAASHSVPAPHESGSGVIAVGASVPPDAA